MIVGARKYGALVTFAPRDAPFRKNSTSRTAPSDIDAVARTTTWEFRVMVVLATGCVTLASRTAATETVVVAEVSELLLAALLSVAIAVIV